MKVAIEQEELWPWYCIDPDDDPDIEVSEETLSRWSQASLDFFQAQREMRKLYEEKHGELFGANLPKSYI